jgi:Fe-S-cluster containining protein
MAGIEPVIVRGSLFHGRPPSNQTRDISIPFELSRTDEPRVGWKSKIMENARSACAKCTGMCCTAFHVAGDLSEASINRMLQNLQEKKDLLVAGIVRAQSLAVIRGEDSIPPMSRDRARLAELETQIKDTAFMKNLIVVGEINGTTIYRCSKFSLTDQRCTVYAERPTMCRNYLCGHAARFGQPPPKEIMYAGRKEIAPQITKMVFKGRRRMPSKPSWRKERRPLSLDGLVEKRMDAVIEPKSYGLDEIAAMSHSEYLKMSKREKTSFFDTVHQSTLSSMPGVSRAKKVKMILKVYEKASKLPDRQSLPVQDTEGDSGESCAAGPC